MKGLIVFFFALALLSEATAQNVINFDAHLKYKRDKAYTITWKAGNTNPVDIELYKGTKWVAGELNLPNNGSYSLKIPTSSEPGKDYRIKITDSNHPNLVVYTDYFRVIPRVPALVKIAPLVLIAVLVVVLDGGTKSAIGTPASTGTGAPQKNLPGGN